MKKFITTFLLLTYAILASAQKMNNADIVLKKQIAEAISNEHTNDRLKDSIGVYAFCIIIKTEQTKGNKSAVKSVQFSNPNGFLMFNNLKFLEKFNYSPLMNGRKKVTLIIPCLNTVVNTGKQSPDCKNNKNYLHLNYFNRYADKLFYHGEAPGEDIIYLSPFIVFSDNTIYD